MLRHADRRLACWTVLLFLLCMPASVAWALDAVTLQLKWTHGFQFAGYYAAVEQGYYRDAGLDVRLLEASPGLDTLQTVVSGKAQYGVGTSSLLLARQAGVPVVVLAVVFQHSPQVLLARRAPRSPETQTVHDLAGKRIMLEPQSDELVAYLAQEGITPDRWLSVAHSFQPRDLVDGRVDAMSAYVTNEPYFLDRSGLSYLTHTPRSGGIDFYGDNLFTTERELNEHPERVRAFRAASLRGWHYAMAHPEEVVDLIVKRYGRHELREFLRFEAKRMEPLLRADLVEVGYMNRGRWQHIVSTYADLGALPRDFTLDGFLYEPEPHVDRTRLYIALALLGAVSAVALYIHRINRRLSFALAESRETQERIRHMAQHDALTDLPNRTLLGDRLQQAALTAKRHGHRVAVLFMDLDGFKRVNDQLGHDTGDDLLRQVATRLRASARESDTVARVGGDEFVAVLGHVHEEADALAVADKMRSALSRRFDVGGQSVDIAASVGIAMYPEHGPDAQTLLKHADQAMYDAKHAGRNRISVFGRSPSP